MTALPRRWLFVLTILVGSFLLFQVQPMVARMVLPKLGGAPAVWNSAMLVYQALLLGGYAYAHWLGRFTVQRQAIIHVALFLVAALWLPIGIAQIAPPGPGQEALWVPLLLLASIGPVFFVVSAQAPLMQRWFAADARAGDPYYLYAASNLGSFAGLISYPALVEPSLPLAAQSWGWTAGYALLVAAGRGECRGALAWPARLTRPAMPPPPTSRARRWRRQLHWLADRGGAVGADAVDDDAPDHRHRRDAAAVGAAARAVSAQLRDRLFDDGPADRGHHLHCARGACSRSADWRCSVRAAGR